MTQPKLAFAIQGCGRHYPWPPQDISGLPVRKYGKNELVHPDNVPADLTALPSVTNILSILAKNLTGWAGEHAIRAGYQHGWPDDVDEAVEKYKWAANRVRDQRADAGTRAHTLAERLAQDLPLPSDISTEDEAFADAYMAFWTDHEPQPLHVEATVLNPEIGYAGTADLFATIGGNVAVIDWKTRGEKPDEKKRKKFGAIYDETRMQLAALASAPWVAHDANGGWHADDAPDVIEAWGVVLYPDGTYDFERLDLVDLDRWFDCFQGVLRAWRAWKGVPTIHKAVAA